MLPRLSNFDCFNTFVGGLIIYRYNNHKDSFLPNFDYYQIKRFLPRAKYLNAPRKRSIQDFVIFVL